MEDDFKCKLLPPILDFNDFDNDWDKYKDELYLQFVNDFITKKTEYDKLKVSIRSNPKENNYEHGFIHLTTIKSPDSSNDVNDRIPDLRRCERLKWVKILIENYPCIKKCNNCNGIQYYEEYYKNNIRINLVLPEAKFKVVLEKRSNYYLLITGYYLTYNHNVKKELQKIAKFQKQKTPLI